MNECENIETNERLPALKIVIVALACLGIFLVVVSLMGHNVSADPVPSFAAGYTVSTNPTVWDSGSATWVGTLTVPQGMNLTMKDCTVTMTTSTFTWTVNQGGNLTLKNVTMNININSQFNFYGIVKMTNSQIIMTSYNYYYVYAGGIVTMNNVTITTNNFFYFYEYGVLRMNNTKLSDTGSQVTHNLYHGGNLTIDNSTMTIVSQISFNSHGVFKMNNSKISTASSGTYIYAYNDATGTSLYNVTMINSWSGLYCYSPWNMNLVKDTSSSYINFILYNFPQAVMTIKSSSFIATTNYINYNIMTTATMTITSSTFTSGSYMNIAQIGNLATMTIASSTFTIGNSYLNFGNIGTSAVVTITSSTFTMMGSTYLYFNLGTSAILTIKSSTFIITNYLSFNIQTSAIVTITSSTFTTVNYYYFVVATQATMTITSSTITTTNGNGQYNYCNPNWVYSDMCVQDNAKLTIEASNIIVTQNANGNMNWYFSSYSQVRINNTNLKNVYAIYCFGYNTQITNSSLVGSYYGIYPNANNGANWGSTGPIIKNCLISGSTYPIYTILTGNGGIAKIVIENNLMLSNTNYFYVNGGHATIDNNTIIKNSGDGVYTNNLLALVFNDNVIQNNGGVGWRFYNQNTELEVDSNSIINNVGGDIYLSNALMKSVNNGFNKVTAAGNSVLSVYWYLDVKVSWQDGSGPVADAKVDFDDAKHSGLVPSGQTGADGWIKHVLVKEFAWNSAGQQMYTPYRINATKFNIMTSTNVTVHKNTQVRVILDNVPPILQIETPPDMFLTNSQYIFVKGYTEPGAKCTVNSMNLTLDQMGWFETTLNFTTNGAHDIRLECKDASTNARVVKRTVVLDTKAPTLTITGPAMGFLTNQSAILITAETEPGAFAEVNGMSVTVNKDGKINAVLMLDDGVTTIFVKVRDQAGNTVEANVTVNLDTVPPNLSIVDPVDRANVITSDLKVTGYVEDGSTLKINGIDAKFQGTSFTYTIHLSQGDNTIKVEAWDKAGNYNCRMVTVSMNYVPPTITITSPRDGTFTNQKVVVVTGTTQPTNTVTINGETVQVDRGTGYFEKNMVLKLGANKLVLIATDPYGTSVSQTVTVVQSTTPPVLTILSPDNGTLTNQGTIKVQGLTDAAATVTVNGMDVNNDKGKFTIYVQLDEGRNDIIIIARDQAFNTVSVRLVVIMDSTVTLGVGFPYDGMHTYDSAVNVTGSVEPNSDVYIDTGIKAAPDSRGAFSVRLDLTLGENDVTVTGVDHLGNSKTINMVVTRDSPPVAPPPTPKTNTTTSSVGNQSNSWILPIALFLGLVLVALVIAVAYTTTWKRMEKRSKDNMDEVVKKVLEHRRTEEAKTELPKPVPPVVQPAPVPAVQVPQGYRGTPPHVRHVHHGHVTQVPPPTPQPVPAPVLVAPQEVEPEPQVESQPSRSIVDVHSEVVAPSEESTTEFDTRIIDLERRVRIAESNGLDTSKARNSLKLAKFFVGKGDIEKMDKYIRMTNDTLNNIGG